MSRLPATAFALLLALPGIAHAQDRPCRDDQGQPRCTPQAQAAQLALYDVPDIKDLAAKRVQVIRVFFINGYASDVGFVAFTRAPGSDLRVEWREPKGEDGRVPTPPLSGIVPLDVWDTLWRDGEFFDRTLAPLADAPPSMPCLHSWIVRVEAADADGRVRARTASVCDGALAPRFAFRIAAAAVAALPPCGIPDRNRTRNDVTRLAECDLLSGDRTAAALAHNAYRTPYFDYAHDPSLATSLQHLFDDGAEISWPAMPTAKGAKAASELWTAQARTAFVSIKRIYGETSDRVRFDIVIIPNARTEGTAGAPVPATMIWTRRYGNRFRLRSLTLDPATAPAPK